MNSEQRQTVHADEELITPNEIPAEGWRVTDVPVRKRTPQEREERERWLAIRKEEGLKIDPETSEVDWSYAQTLDPYGVLDEWELPEEFRQVGREYFARAPESDIWVVFGDLPEETRNKLWQRHRRNLALPAGLGLGLRSGEDLSTCSQLDLVLGYMWLDLEAARGDDDAAKVRDELSAKMTPEQIADGQRLAEVEAGGPRPGDPIDVPVQPEPAAEAFEKIRENLER